MTIINTETLTTDLRALVAAATTEQVDTLKSLAAVLSERIVELEADIATEGQEAPQAE